MYIESKNYKYVCVRRERAGKRKKKEIERREREIEKGRKRENE